MKFLTLGLILLSKLLFTDANPTPKPCNEINENTYYVESIYFDLEEESEPIKNFIGKIEQMIAYLDLDDGQSRTSFPTSPVRI